METNETRKGKYSKKNLKEKNLDETCFKCRRLTNFRPQPNIGVEEGVITTRLVSKRDNET